MIKTAQDAYLAGRQAAMEKLSMTDELANKILEIEDKDIYLGPHQLGIADQLKLRGAEIGENQMNVLRNVGLTGQGLTRGDQSMAAYDPRQLATLENLSRAGMLAGAGGGAYLGGMDPRAAAIASAGALGGGVVGGNLGQGVNEAIKALGYGDNRDMATSIGGALGGLGGGLGAGYMSR